MDAVTNHHVRGQVPHLESRRFVGGVEIVPGAVATFRPHLDLPLCIRTRCESIDPDAWIGELLLGSRIVHQTDPLPTHEQAGRAAETFLHERLAALLTTQP